MSGAGPLLLFLAMAGSAHAAEVNQRQQECVAQAIYMESRNQPLKGQVAVRDVVRNRAKKLHKKLCSVVYAKRQFEWTSVKKAPYVDLQDWGQVLYARPVLSEDHLYFFKKDMKRPSWSKHMDCRVVIGAHRFCKNPLMR